MGTAPPSGRCIQGLDRVARCLEVHTTKLLLIGSSTCVRESDRQTDRHSGKPHHKQRPRLTRSLGWGWGIERCVVIVGGTCYMVYVPYASALYRKYPKILSYMVVDRPYCSSRRQWCFSAAYIPSNVAPMWCDVVLYAENAEIHSIRIRVPLLGETAMNDWLVVSERWLDCETCEHTLSQELFSQHIQQSYKFNTFIAYWCWLSCVCRAE